MRTGAFTALVTLFDASGDVDHAATAAHVVRLADAGQDGILVCGSSAEFPALDEAERMAVCETAIEAAAGRLSIAVHVGTPATRSSIRLARHAAAAGADTIAAVTPYYLKTDGVGLALHLSAIRDAVPDRPLLAYSIGKLAGYEHPVDVLADLAAREVVHGVKESGEDLGRLLDIRDACGPGFAVFAGSPNLQAAVYGHGLDGAILGLSNVAPTECTAIARHARAGEHGAAEALAARLRPLAAALGVGTPMAALKYGMTARFGTSPDVRAPRHGLTEGEQVRVRAGIAAAGLTAA
jgi:4-hydroxy-tetrahydrodipicolinate synthase